MAEPFSLLIGLIVLCLVIYVLWWALSKIPMPEPLRVVAVVLFVLIVLSYVIQRYGLL